MDDDAVNLLKRAESPDSKAGSRPVTIFVIAVLQVGHCRVGENLFLGHVQNFGFLKLAP